MGRELCLQLVSKGCHVATCDILEENLLETLALCKAQALDGTPITAHECDVANEDQVARIKKEICEQRDQSYQSAL